MSRRSRLAGVALGATVALVAAGCSSASSSSASSSSAGGGSSSCKSSKSPVLTLAAYSNPYDAYGKLTSSSGTFATGWKKAHKQSVIFQMSFGGSTTQAQNIVNGFPADIYASSLDPDVSLVQKAGLITHDWLKDPDQSVVATSVVGFMVRPGNPKGIHNWNDLAKPGVKILTPDPAQSGGAKWNIVAAYGAAMRGKVPGYAASDSAAAQRLLTGIFKNVTVMDKSANDSFKNFESGNGDVAITYENQALAGIASGSKDQFVIPSSTILIQTPTVVVDKNAKAHCVESLANAFVAYLHTPDAQKIFQTAGYQRPVGLEAAQKGDGTQYPPIKDLFTADQVGGWSQIVTSTVFGSNGAFTQAFKAAKG
ncbi:MAG TPA: sulfate ABC transporter substrate-binding protein [Streptosporangiaceae bacterium]|nr:sulfate ABC transporter substrate-binding protein [Streptosporangiaceae bacterium]